MRINRERLEDSMERLGRVGATPRGGLTRLKGLLRPGAPIIAGEPAPSLFWDIARGIRSGWWARWLAHACRCARASSRSPIS